MTDEETECGWREMEHTADAGLEVWGPDLASLLEAAGEGFIELLLDPETVKRTQTREMEVAEADAETLLVSWLEEILFALEVHRLAPAAVRVESADERHAKGVLYGEPLDRDAHDIRTVLKAVTYHGLEVVRRDGLLQAKIIVDV